MSGIEIFKSAACPTPKILTVSWLALGTTTITAGAKAGQTATGDSSNGTTDEGVQVTEHSLSEPQYFVGAFLPTLLAVIFTIPWRIIESQIKSLEPFRKLAEPDGAAAEDSLLLSYDGVSGIAKSLAALWQSQLSVFVSSLLVYSSILVPPLAAEAVKLGLEGPCSHDEPKNCYVRLDVTPGALRALQAVLAYMGLLTLVLIFVLRGWKSGLISDARSIAGTAALCLNPEVQSKLQGIVGLASAGAGRISTRDMSTELHGLRFGLGYFQTATGQEEYGLVLVGQPVVLNREGREDALESAPRRKTARPDLQALLGVFSLVVYFLALMAVLLLYHLSTADNGFERFMDSETFGVRFLFTLAGTVTETAWSWLHRSKIGLLEAPIPNPPLTFSL